MKWKISDVKKYKNYMWIVLLVVIVVVLSVVVNLGITGVMTAKGTEEQREVEFCPFECCSGTEYTKRPCQGNYECVDYQCVKKECPYQCCPEGEYNARKCGIGYFCFNNLCKAIDSDNDGLPDLEERQLGTNVNLYDSDSDTLNDYFEVKVIGTDPLKRNTDGDRYIDGNDPNPLKVNTAKIETEVLGEEWEWNELGLWALGNLKGDMDMLIATGNVDLRLKNTGDDYTEYVDFELVFLLSGNEVKRTQETLGRLEPNRTKEIHYSYDFRLSDLTNIDITEQSSDLKVVIENIKYEKF